MTTKSSIGLEVKQIVAILLTIALTKVVSGIREYRSLTYSDVFRRDCANVALKVNCAVGSSLLA